VVAAGAPEVYHLVVVPDGPRSWLVASTNETVLRAKIAALTSATPSAPIASPALSAWKDMHMTAGGFFTIRSLVDLARQSMKGLPDAKHVQWDDILRHLPAGGTTPVVITSSPGAPTADDPGGSRQAEITIPADAVRDAMWLGMQLDAP
jgi:hypothetical protein